MDSVVIIGPSNNFGGYADTTNQLVLAFDKLGINVRLVSTDGYSDEMVKYGDVRVPNGTPRIYNDTPVHEDSEHQYIYTVFELDLCPPEWEWVLSLANRIWLPSTFVSHVFDSSFPDIARKFSTIPHGVEDCFSPNVKPLSMENVNENFKFLAVANAQTWADRKNTVGLVEAFCKEFKKDEDAALILKGSLQMDCLELEVMKMIKKYDQPNIYIFKEYLPHDKLPRLYAACNAFVTATHGEGFGKPLLEAMACGMLVIAPNHSGYLDFMTSQNSLLVDVGDWEPIGRYPYVWFKPYMKWKTPTPESLQANMRLAFEKDHTMLRNNAVQKAKKYTWERTVTLMKQSIEGAPE
jgi:glycosyltransferase involved in cell wall biosynthesis